MPAYFVAELESPSRPGWIPTARQPRFREELMSPLLDSPLTESWRERGTDTTTTVGAFRGTDGSNPVSSG
jgi:hypothetical protein